MMWPTARSARGQAEASRVGPNRPANSLREPLYTGAVPNLARFGSRFRSLASNWAVVRVDATDVDSIRIPHALKLRGGL